MEDYFRKGWTHGDVAWRNIGIRRSASSVVAVVFDMDQVVETQHQDKVWVDEMMEKLQKRS